MDRPVSWRCAGTVTYDFGFGRVRLYHTTSTINHVRAELMNPTVIH